MRKTLLAIPLLFLVVGCSSTKVEEIKNKVAVKVSVAVEKELKEAYDGVEIVGVDCMVEAEEIGENVYNEVSRFLKIKESAKQKSVAGELVPVLCNLIVDQVFPMLIKDPDGEYACLRSVGSDKIEKVGKDLCSAIDL